MPKCPKCGKECSTYKDDLIGVSYDCECGFTITAAEWAEDLQAENERLKKQVKEFQQCEVSRTQSIEDI